MDWSNAARQQRIND